jgi:hypothetical protein
MPDRCLGSGANPLLTFNSFRPFRPFNSFILLLLLQRKKKERKKEIKLKDPVKVYD